MVVADLHVHTTASDGTLDPEDVPAAARSAGLEAVAVTDHERVPGWLSAPYAERDGLAVVRGIELRVETDDGRVDLLGYGLEGTEALSSALDRIQRDRMARGRTMVERVEDHLGIELDVAIEPGLGRPDVARAVADHPDTDYHVQGVFDELIGDDRPLYVSREIPSFERGQRLLAEACDLVSLAHPLRYDDPESALALAADLDAVELAYPYEEPIDLAPVERAIEHHDLLATGGSDAHGETLGTTGLEVEAWERVRDRLTE